MLWLFNLAVIWFSSFCIPVNLYPADNCFNLSDYFGMYFYSDLLNTIKLKVNPGKMANIKEHWLEALVSEYTMIVVHGRLCMAYFN